MPHRDTSVAIQQAINLCPKSHTGIQAYQSNKIFLIDRSQQYGVTLSTSVFSVYMLQVKVNTRNNNSYVTIYIT